MNLSEDYEIRRFNYLDGDRLFGFSEEALIVFCSWDKIGGRGHQFIEKFKSTEKLKQVPLQVIIDPSKKEEIHRSELKCQSLIT